MSKYLIELERRLRGGTRGNDGLNFLRRDDVENAVSQVNLQVSSSNLRDQAVKKVNEALEGQDPDVLVECLQEPILGLTEFIHPYAATLYLKGNNCYNAKTILTVLPTLQCPISKQSFQF